MTCKICSTTIRGEQVIVCEGFCKQSHHIRCVGLTSAEFVTCIQNPHVFWICTACSKMLREIRYRKATQDEFNKTAANPADGSENAKPTECDTSNAIAELKNEVAAIHKTLAEFTATRLDTTNAIENNEPLAHSSPTLPDRMLKGCRDVGERRRDNSSDKFWLFFTHIKNDVTEEEMLSMVSDSLGSDSDTFFVKKLVPAWKDTSLLPFISYKVGIDTKFKERALCSSTWPRGVCFREFRERYDIWEPERNNRPNRTAL